MKGDTALQAPDQRDRAGPPFPAATRTPSVHRARRARREGWGKGSHLSGASGLSHEAEAEAEAPHAAMGTPRGNPPSHRNFSLECSLSLGSEGLANTDDEAHTVSPREGSDSQGAPGDKDSENIKAVNTGGPLAGAPSRQLRSRSSRRSGGSALPALDQAQDQQHQSPGSTAAAAVPRHQTPQVPAFLQFLPPTPSGSPASPPMIIASPPPGATIQPGAGSQPGIVAPTTLILPQGLSRNPKTDNLKGSSNSSFDATQATAGMLPMGPSAIFSGAGLPGVGTGGAPCVMLDSRMVLPPGSPAAAAAAAAMAGRAGFSLVLPYAQNRRVAGKGKGPGTGRRACGCPARMCKCGACPPKPANARRQKGKGPGTGRRACGCPSRRCSCGAAALLSLPQIPVLVPLVMDPTQQQPQQTPATALHLLPGFGPGQAAPAPGQPGQMALCATKDGYILTPLPAGQVPPQSAGVTPIVMPVGVPGGVPGTEPGCEEAKGGIAGDAEACRTELCTDLRLGSPGTSWASGAPRGSKQRQQPRQQPQQQHVGSPTVSSSSKLSEDEEREEAEASGAEGGDCARPVWMRQLATREGGPHRHPGTGRRDIACEAKGKRLLFESGAPREGTTLGPAASDSEVVVGPMSVRAPTPTADGMPRISLSLSPSCSDSSDEKEAPSGSLLTDASALGLKHPPHPSPPGSHSLSHSHSQSNPRQHYLQQKQQKMVRKGSLSGGGAAEEVSHLQNRIRWELRSLARALAQQGSAAEASEHGGRASDIASADGCTPGSSLLRLSPLQPSHVFASAVSQCGARTRSLLLQLHRLSCIPNDCCDPSAGVREAPASETAISPQAVFLSCKLKVKGCGSTSAGTPVVRCSGVCGRMFHPECLLPCGGSSASSSSSPGGSGSGSDFGPNGSSSSPSSMVTEMLEGPTAGAPPTSPESNDKRDFPGTPVAASKGPGAVQRPKSSAPTPSPLQVPQPPLFCHACRCWAGVFRAVLDLLPTPPSARGPRPRMTSSSSCSNMLAAAGRASEAAGAPRWTWQDIMPPAVMEQWVLWARDVLGPVAAASGAPADEAGVSEAGGVPMSASGSGSGSRSGVVTLTGSVAGLGMGEESGMAEDEAVAALRAGTDEVLGDEDEDMEEGEGEGGGGEKVRSLSLDRGVGVVGWRASGTPLGASRALEERQGCSCSGGGTGACAGCDSDGSSLYETLLEGVRLMCRAHAQAMAMGEPHGSATTPSPGSPTHPTAAAACAGTPVEDPSAAAASRGGGVTAYQRCAAALASPESPLATPHSSAWEAAPPSIPPTPPLHSLSSPLSGWSHPPLSALDPDTLSARDGGLTQDSGAPRKDGVTRASRGVSAPEVSLRCAPETHPKKESSVQAQRLSVVGPMTPDTKMQTRSSSTSAAGEAGAHTGLRPLAVPPITLGGPGAGTGTGESAHGVPLEKSPYPGMLCLSQSPASLTSIPATPAGGGAPTASGGQAQTVLLLALGNAEALGSAAGAPGGSLPLCSAGGASESGAPQQYAVMPVHLGESLAGAAGGGLKRGASGAPAAGNVGYFYCYYVQNGDASVAGATVGAGAAADGASGEQCGEESRKRRRKQFQPRSTAQLEAPEVVVAC